MRMTPFRAMEAVNALFARLPRGEVKRLLDRREMLSLKHGMFMNSSLGERKIIPIQLRPWVFSAQQKRFFHRTVLLLGSALDRLLPLYLQNEAVRRILPLEPKEREWITRANQPRLQSPRPVLDRIDATATFTPADWRENFWFLEPNSVGIGGVHYIPGTCGVGGDWVGPVLKKHLPALRLRFPDDIRELMRRMFLAHARALGGKLRRVVLIEDQSEPGGTEEFPQVARFLKRHGMDALVADPGAVVLRRGALVVRGKPVDLVYRDTELRDLVRMAPRRVAGVREAFHRNRVISALAGDLDHKSTWELFTNPEFSKHFTLSQRRLFREHVLWTRLIFPRKTTDPKGKRVELTAFLRRHREKLTIKPNRAYGGEGVLFGHAATQAAWEKEIACALRAPGTHVVQQTVSVRSELFPVADAAGRVRLTPFYAVTGFAATRDGIAILGRSSREQVVNVSRRGGLIPVWALG